MTTKAAMTNENLMKNTRDTTIEHTLNGHGTNGAGSSKNGHKASAKKKRKSRAKPATAHPALVETVEAATDATSTEPATALEAPAPEAETAPSLRLRLKVWTDTATKKRYLVPNGFMRDMVNGQPVSDVMYTYALSDTTPLLVTLTANEWNALPFFYFQEDGDATADALRSND